MNDFFKARDVLKVGDKDYVIYRLDALEKAGLTNLKTLPFSIRVVLEAALRQCNDLEIKQNDVKNIAAWTPNGIRPGIPFLPARVIMQDFTGVPAVVDLAAMRAAVARLGGEPRKITPRVPEDLVIDHSIQLISSRRSTRSRATLKWSSSETANATNSLNGDRRHSATSALSRR